MKITKYLICGLLISSLLTGCGGSSDIPAKSDSSTTASERSDSLEVESTKEAEKEIEEVMTEEVKTEEVKTEETENLNKGPGLYQSDGSFIPWDDLGIDVETDYTQESFGKEDKMPNAVFNLNNYDGKLVLPDNITRIGDWAFGNSPIRSIVFPDTLTSIGEMTFSGCDSFTNIELPDTLTSIANCAFWECDLLASIDLPDTLTNIESGAFAYCDSLTSIELPNTLESIGSNVFGDCNSLTNVSYAGTIEEWDAVEKLNYWYGHSSKVETVTCSDGVITL